jgi:hypothetical protein
MTRARTIYCSHAKMVPYLTESLPRDQDDLGEAGQRPGGNRCISHPGMSTVIGKSMAEGNVTYDQSGTIFLRREKNSFNRSTSEPSQCF